MLSNRDTEINSTTRLTETGESSRDNPYRRITLWHHCRRHDTWHYGLIKPDCAGDSARFFRRHGVPAVSWLSGKPVGGL